MIAVASLAHDELPGARPLAEVIERIRAEHALLRTLMDRVLIASWRPPTISNGLAGAVWDLYVTFESHLGMEETLLIPHIVASAGGIMHAERWLEEHRRQRTMLLALVDDCLGQTKPLEQLADDARWLAARLAKDMDAEEDELYHRSRQTHSGQG